MGKKEQRGKFKHLKRWNKIPSVQTQEEFQDFIKQSLENRDGINRKVKIGEMTENARKRMKEICGKSVSNIGIDNDGIIHAHQDKHNLEPDDLLNAADIINTAANISLSERKHKQCDVLTYKKYINGDIDILVEVHESKDYLMIFDAMRKKKAQRRPDATKLSPGAYVQNATLPAVNNNIPHPPQKVKGKNKFEG
jgi:hypothetical protein